MTSVMVTTGSRLHFGLTRVCADEKARYGGVGVMLESPCTRLQMRRVDEPVDDPASRARQFARLWLDYLSSQSDLRIDDCFVEIDCGELPVSHSGLGSGTQLAQATAAGINRLFGLPPTSALEVARVLDRGQRSLIGTLGFENGGLIVDRPGLRTPANVSGIEGLAARVALPDDWRVVLIRHPGAKRTYGQRERALFNELRNRPCPESTTLEGLIDNGLLYAANARNFHEFSDAVYEYGRLSGEYYREIQGGPYNGPIVNGIVEDVRRMAVRGVGQSSWGPVVFAWCSDQDQASAVANALQHSLDESTVIETTRVRNLPADIKLNQSEGS